MRETSKYYELNPSATRGQARTAWLAKSADVSHRNETRYRGGTNEERPPSTEEMAMPSFVSNQPTDDGPSVTLTRGELRELVREAVREALQKPRDSEWLFADDQSVLGKIQFGEAAQRRIHAGLRDAGKIGRRWTMTRAALADELAKLGRTAALPKQAEPSATEALRAELGGAP